MATTYTPDDRAAALKLYLVNHPEAGMGMQAEKLFWQNVGGLAAIPWGVDRGTAFTAAAVTVAVTLTEDSPWKREREFWRLWQAKPPTALP